MTPDRKAWERAIRERNVPTLWRLSDVQAQLEALRDRLGLGSWTHPTARLTAARLLVHRRNNQ